MLDDITQALKAHERAIEIAKALRVLNDMHTAAADKELVIEGKVGERVVAIGGLDLAGPVQQQIETAATGLLAELATLHRMPKLVDDPPASAQNETKVS